MALIVVPHECSDEKEHIMCSSNLLSLLFAPHCVLQGPVFSLARSTPSPSPKRPPRELRLHGARSAERGENQRAPNSNVTEKRPCFGEIGRMALA